MAGRKSGETLLLLRDFVTSCEFFLLSVCLLPLLPWESSGQAEILVPQDRSRRFPTFERAGAVQDLAEISQSRNYGSPVDGVA